MNGRDILIVEDENIVALDMRMRLESMGYRVVDVVDTGNAAAERAAELKPDLVLMDIKLKGDQDGIDAAERLHEYAEVPVIFVTAFTDERTLERVKRASPYGYIVKPFHERELRIAIELALYKHNYELSLRRDRDIAEEANRVKGEFLANMSHELKTPLNSVIGFTELALAGSKDSEQCEYLSMALSSAKSLLTLIDSILDFARMEAGKLAAVPTPFSLDRVLGECADSLAMGAFAKGLDATLGRDPGIPDALVGDSSLLKHILLNLLDNAVKFTDRGRVRLEARLSEPSSYAASGLMIDFDVSDTGIGMPSDKLGQAFTRFTQLDPSKTRKAGGTGLGLAIVAKSVELMNGSLSVESEEGRGTRFALRLPFGRGAEEESGSGAEAVDRVEEAALAGFDDESYADASLIIARLGYAPRRVKDLEDLYSSTDVFVVADERAISGVAKEGLLGLESRLIVGTRFGGGTRSRLGNGDKVVFTPLPLRADGLRAALASLSCLAQSPRTRGLGENQAKLAKERRETKDALEMDPLPEAGSPAIARAVDGHWLRRLADTLEETAVGGSFAAAEREAKDAQGALTESGNAAGARLAFSALLLARKRDATGLREAASRMREMAEEG